MAKNKIMTDLAVRISTQTAELKKGLRKASGQLKTFGMKAKTASKEFSAGFKGAFTGVAGMANPMMAQLTSILGGATSGMKALTKGTKLWKVAIASTGVGLLVIALGALVTWLNNTKEGMLVMSRATEVVKAVIGVVLDRIAKFGGAIVKLFSGDFQGAWDDAKGAVAGVGDQIVDVAKKADQIAKDEDANTKKEIANKKKIAKLLEENGNLRLKSRDIDKYTADERQMFAAQELKNLREVNKMKTETLDDEIDLLERRQALGENTLEDDMELANLQQKRAQEVKNMLLQEKELMMLGQDIRRQKEAQEKAEIKIAEAKQKQLAADQKMAEKLFGKKVTKTEPKMDKDLLDKRMQALGDAAEKELEINQNKLDRIAEQEAQAEAERQQRQQMTFDFINGMMDAMANIQRANMNKELAAAGDNEKKKEEIKKKYAKKEKKMAIMRTLISGAEGVAKTIATLGMPLAIPFIALAAATTAAQIAAIASQNFAMGGVVDKGFSLATVGERGKETVALPRGSRVVSHADTMKALGQSNGKAVKVMVEDVLIRGEDLRIVLSEANRRKLNTL